MSRYSSDDVEMVDCPQRGIVSAPQQGTLYLGSWDACVAGVVIVGIFWGGHGNDVMLLNSHTRSSKMERVAYFLSFQETPTCLSLATIQEAI